MASGQTSSKTDPVPATVEFVRRAPSPELAGVVSELIGYRELVAGYSRHTEAASLIVPLVISFGEAFAIGLSRPPNDNDRFGSFASGLHAGPVTINSYGRSCCVQVNFPPLGAWRFFAIPLRELSDRMVALDDVLGAAGRALRDRLGSESDWHRRLDIVERFVIDKMRKGPTVAPEVQAALNGIAASGGRARMATLAADVGWSRKHLANRFADQIGLGPKTVSRIVRFNRTASLARCAPDVDWAGLALDCGYADQAHLVREFRELSGTTPTELHRH